MKKGLKQMIRKSLPAVLMVMGCTVAYAQSNVQEGNMPAPANVKIDGKLTEWGDDFKAYNKATLLYYNMANDDNNLYLAIKSTNQGNNTKILSGGITFAINTAGKKKDENAYIITFPQVNRSLMRNQYRSRSSSGGSPQPLDSAAIADMRKQAIATVKEIRVSGFKDIQDSVISIYNEYGIKAAVNYDNNGNLIYELALPLKLLNISAASPKEFAYNVKVNALKFSRDRDGSSDRSERGDNNDRGSRERGSSSSRGGYSGSSRSSRGGSGFSRGGMDFQSMLSATDFWGKYTLVKK